MNNYVNSPCISPQSHTRKGMFIPGLRILVIFFALLIRTALSIDLITNFQGLSAYTLLLLWYLYAEAKNLWMRETHLFWVNPVILASLFTFVLAFGATNVLFFLPEEMITPLGLQPIVTPWMNQLMLLVVLGACAMWTGYSSAAGRSLGQTLQRSYILRAWISTSMRVNKPALYICLAVSLTARLWAINLGVYGYSSTYDQLIASAAYIQYLGMAESLGRLALVAAGIQCFASPRSIIQDRLLVWLIFSYEVVFGFISGFKSQVVMPFVIVGIVYYAQRNRFHRLLAPAIVIAVIAAYAVIDPFRAARNEDPGFSGTSLSSIVTTMIHSDDDRIGRGEKSQMWLSFLGRSNSTYTASLGIEYAANNKLPTGSPQFLGDIFLAPAHAFIPRLLWVDKSVQDVGYWYTKEVIGHDIFTSTGMSPFTYLNFAGGPLAVIIGFLIVGILQRGLFDGLRVFGGGGLIVLFGLLNTLVNIESAFNSFFVGIIRALPLLVITQYFLLKRQRGAPVSALKE